MTAQAFSHQTVLLHEAVEALAIQPDGTYVDCTFGRGGHSQLILSKLNENGRLIAFDKDLEAIAAGEALAQKDKRFILVHSGFGHFLEKLNQLNIEKIDGVLMDLGVSSPQIDDAQRGFSFRFDAPLDMRMDTSKGETAARWLATAAESDIAKVIKDYGEERFARQIAAAIVAQRAITPIQTTRELALLVGKNVRTREPGQDPATRTFQAIRIYINRELEELGQTLPSIARRLNAGGILVVISFHSLEDRVVKHFMRRASSEEQFPSWVMVRQAQISAPSLEIKGKPVRPSSSEIAANPRARSAIMRVAQRTQAPWRETHDGT